MKTYIKFIINIFLRSFFYVLFIVFSLVFIINILTEIEFFKNIEVIFFLLFTYLYLILPQWFSKFFLSYC